MGKKGGREGGGVEWTEGKDKGGGEKYRETGRKGRTEGEREERKRNDKMDTAHMQEYSSLVS